MSDDIPASVPQVTPISDHPHKTWMKGEIAEEIKRQGGNGGGGEPPIEILARITKLESDLVKLENRIETNFSKQESQIVQLSAKFDVGFAKIDSNFSNMETKIAQTESSLVKWGIGFTIAVIGVILAIARFTNDKPTQSSQPQAPVIQIVPLSVPIPTSTATNPIESVKINAQKSKSNNTKNK